MFLQELCKQLSTQVPRAGAAGHTHKADLVASWFLPGPKVCVGCGSEHRPKHFNEGTYTVVTDGDRDLGDRFPLCQHLKGSKQPPLLPPTAKRHACLCRKRAHESTAAHSGKICPSVQRAVIRNILQQSICDPGESFVCGYG